jgi:hypothetical protein
MNIPTHAELVAYIDRFLERHGMAPSRLGRDTTGEASLVSMIREGRQPSLDVLKRLFDFMAEKDAAGGFAEAGEAAADDAAEEAAAA